MARLKIGEGERGKFTIQELGGKILLTKILRSTSVFGNLHQDKLSAPRQGDKHGRSYITL